MHTRGRRTGWRDDLSSRMSSVSGTDSPTGCGAGPRRVLGWWLMGPGPGALWTSVLSVLLKVFSVLLREGFRKSLLRGNSRLLYFPGVAHSSVTFLNVSD